VRRRREGSTPPACRIGRTRAPTARSRWRLCKRRRRLPAAVAGSWLASFAAGAAEINAGRRCYPQSASRPIPLYRVSGVAHNKKRKEIAVGHIDHLSHGLLTPAFGFLVMCMAAVIGLRCTVRAMSTKGRSKRMWLFVGATAIASGIWTLHFIAMIGFGVAGTAIRYDVPLTLISLVLAIAVVSAGVFTVGYGRSRGLALFIGGLGTGLGVATMHYSGMAAVQLNGAI